MKITVTYSPEEERAAQNLVLIFINNFPGCKLKESKNNLDRGVIYIKTPPPHGPAAKKQYTR